MARWIGIDYGKRRVGIAVTDPLGLISSPHKTLTPNEVIPFLQDYLTHELVEGIVLGMPRTLENEEGPIAHLVKQFTRMLHRYFPTMPLYHHDERFTTKLAQVALREAGLKKKKRKDKDLLNAVSASFILRSFLELHARDKSQPVTPLF
ncbi:MAG: Holliday junction resolvase RuvX [Bacteroidota bacterium]